MFKRKRKENENRHICTLDLADNDMKIYTSLSLKLVSPKHPRTTTYFRSIPAINKERKRHLETPHGNCVIHPFSIFRFYWEVLQIISILLSLIVIPCNLIYGQIVEHLNSGLYRIEHGLNSFFRNVELATDVIHFVDIFLHFVTGYYNFSKREVNLNIHTIWRQYVFSIMFIIDLACCTSLVCLKFFFHIFRVIFSENELYAIKLVGLIRVLRIIRLFQYFDIVMIHFNQHYFSLVSLRIVTVVLLIIHWFTCGYAFTLQFSNVYGLLDTDRVFNSMQSPLIITKSYKEIYLDSCTIVMSYLLGIRMKQAFILNGDSRAYTVDQFCFFLVTSTLGIVICNGILLAVVHLILTYFGPETKYHGVISQVHKFLEDKAMFKTLRNRIIWYYNYKFQRKYFCEEVLLDTLSLNLRNEIKLHACRNLIDQVPLLRDLPKDIIAKLVPQLQFEVFLYNDMIVKAGSLGDCMYFIASGTVAVLTPTGRELCHLQDGAYFGEVVLVRKNQRRIANVLAIEMCELYRLDRATFTSCFDTDSLFYKQIERTATERMEKTVLLEELHRKYLQDRTIRQFMKAEEILSEKSFD